MCATAGAVALLTGDMLLHAVLRSGLLRASYIDEYGQQQPAGPLFVVQVRFKTTVVPNHVQITMNWNHLSLCSSSICSWPSPELSSCWALWCLSSSFSRDMPCSIPTWLLSTRPPMNGTKVEVTFVSIVTQVQQETISVVQDQTTPKDITTAEGYSETWGRFSSLHNLLRKKTIEKKILPSLLLCCVYSTCPWLLSLRTAAEWRNKVYISDFFPGLLCLAVTGVMIWTET